LKGDVCGSIILDQSMEQYVSQRLGRRWSGLSIRERNMFKNNRWQTMKCNFDGSSESQFAEIGKVSKLDTFNPLKKKGRGGLRVEKDGVHFAR
jgi:hypothetical protein